MSESVQFSSVAQSCLTLCDPVDCSTPGLPVHHQLPELTQTHVRVVKPEVAVVRSGKPGSTPTFPTLASRLSAMPCYLLS